METIEIKGGRPVEAGSALDFNGLYTVVLKQSPKRFCVNCIHQYLLHSKLKLSKGKIVLNLK